MPALGKAKKNKSPRRRTPPRWVKPAVKISTLAMVVVGSATALTISWKHGTLGSGAAAMNERIVNASAAFGLTVQDVLEIGRAHV